MLKLQAMYYHANMVSDDELTELRIWNSAEPTITNKNTPKMIGPTCMLYYFFWN